MNSYIVKRLAILIPVLLGMTLIVFSIIHAIPGDPAETILGDKATEQSKQALREQLGLDKPWLQQYGTYLSELARGDLGDSIRTRQPIAREMVPYLAATLELTVASMFFAIVVGMNAGIVSAWKRNSWFDYVSMVIALVGVSMPIFWLGLMEQWIFANKLHWLPSIGRMNSRDPVEAVTHLAVIDAVIGGRMDQVWTVIKHLILPSIALGTIPMAVIARITRSSMLEVMDADYIRTARAKGLASFQVVYKHALKNAAIPVLTVIGLQTGSLLGGAVLTETIFAWPGIGRYIFEAISSRDYPVIQSGILIIAFLFVIINLIVDLLYAVLDRRIRYQ
ncbi:ABC transporter permease [Paenibacillus sp. P2(2022)]|uniref:ABC transporter permease n=1 Tax=Paenibacillus TaxID=44249 RepID=UPI0005ECD46D|nr:MULTISPECIES: ABC transporter permease [Paenibacillus]AUS25415.1 peptide ABC transporter permease [Paenibacillus polymyxa]KJK31891.1 peptide ABC transporter permease [Paenibacillus polymyxa]MDG0054986.1 ABC transporter permease [Paenibacillus sp. P2(2022)]MDN4082540.1 ABC transporter permease [Paenibacillus polymyxa]MDN4109884.1 ABC transporter permease [Paenibacillus polymyxa]